MNTNKKAAGVQANGKGRSPKSLSSEIIATEGGRSITIQRKTFEETLQHLSDCCAYLREFIDRHHTGDRKCPSYIQEAFVIEQAAYGHLEELRAALGLEVVE